MLARCQAFLISTYILVLQTLFFLLPPLSILSIFYLVLLSLRQAPLSFTSFIYFYNLARQADHVDRESLLLSTVFIHSFFDTLLYTPPSLSIVRLSDPPQLSISFNMIFTKLACAVALTSAVAYASPANNGGNAAAAAAAGGSGGTTLSANAIQKGSFNDGSDEIGANEVGQALSATSQNNFINNCAGKTLTNGLQITTGSCNGISKYSLSRFQMKVTNTLAAMGDIPAKTAMVSSIIINPQTGQEVPSDTTFNITVQMANIVAGSFTNADATYYAAPQTLSGGKVVGHTHVTVQDLGNSLNPTQALDATQFAFFKGINDAGNGQGLLSAVVTGGLPAGNYRVCTMASASNHQPVLMPVAQRGTPDDCTKFVVTGNGNTPNAAANDGSGGLAAAVSLSLF